MGNNASFLLVDKKRDITSFSALRTVKYGIDKKVGHAGTLDRFAEGLLLVFTGSMTHLNNIFSSLDKTYDATITFGSETDTLDPDGQVIAEGPVPSFECVRRLIGEKFLGTMEQVPPSYSAVHVNGARASKLTRQGIEVEILPRTIQIHRFEIFSYEDGNLKCRISVSKGTYIRSIARDLGRMTGGCAHLSALRRIQIGPYFVDEAVGCDDEDALRSSMGKSMPLLLRLPSMRKMEAPLSLRWPMANGRYCPSLVPLDEKEDARYALVVSEGKLRWIVDRKEEKILCQIGGESNETA